MDVRHNGSNRAGKGCEPLTSTFLRRSCDDEIAMMGFEFNLTQDVDHAERATSDTVTGILGMLATKMNIELAVLDAQQWKVYEGVQKVVSGDSGRMIVVITSCNPAAITAPIPSFFHGFPVSFCEVTRSPQDLDS